MKRKVNHSLRVMIVFTAFFITCTPAIKLHTDFDKRVDFSKYKTYSFYGFTDKTPGLSELNRKRIIDAINTEMMAHGFVRNEDKPDVLVNATTILKEKTKVSNTNYYGYGGVYRPYYWGPGHTGDDYNVYKYNEGSLIIDVIDANAKHLIWQGTGNSEIDIPMKDPDVLIPKAVKRILSSFPPGTVSKK